VVVERIRPLHRYIGKWNCGRHAEERRQETRLECPFTWIIPVVSSVLLRDDSWDVCQVALRCYQTPLAGSELTINVALSSRISRSERKE
jgi:hypothetical protein